MTKDEAVKEIEEYLGDADKAISEDEEYIRGWKSAMLTALEVVCKIDCQYVDKDNYGNDYHCRTCMYNEYGKCCIYQKMVNDTDTCKNYV